MRVQKARHEIKLIYSAGVRLLAQEELLGADNHLGLDLSDNEAIRYV
jgi:hypothetical protein